MSMLEFKRFVNGGGPALIKHVFALLGVIIAGIIAGTLLYVEVKATSKNTDANRKHIKTIEQSIEETVIQQRLLIQRFDTEKEANKEFRSKTSNTLDKILERLPRYGGPER
jgi:hypothetical protein